MMVDEKENLQRKHGAEHPATATSHGKRLNTLRRIVPSGVKLLPNVPIGTGRTTSKSR